MFLPSIFVEERSHVVLSMLRQRSFGHLVCGDNGDLLSTPVPFIVDDEVQSVRMHLARPNPIFKQASSSALLIVPAGDAYISPSWYKSKAEHGKVVPTWNYEVVHLHGSLEIHDNSEWLYGLLNDLTDYNERSNPTPWRVSDAPDEFIATTMKGIIGLELHVERIEAKRKLSQNRSAPDRDGVLEGLRQQDSSDNSIARSMGHG